MDPSRRPSSTDRSNSHEATRPAITAVTMVPTNASEIAGRSTGRISTRPEARPPSNRIRTSAMTPILRASS
jgi:hypothetical protein